MTPTMRDINKKFSVRYYLNLVLIDEEERRYFKQQVGRLKATCVSPNEQQRELIKQQTKQLKSELVLYFAHWNSFFPLQQLIGGGWFFHPYRTSCIVFLSKSSNVLITLSLLLVVEVRCEIRPSRLRNLLVTLGRIIGISDLLAKPWAFIEA